MAFDDCLEEIYYGFICSLLMELSNQFKWYALHANSVRAENHLWQMHFHRVTGHGAIT